MNQWRFSLGNTLAVVVMLLAACATPEGVYQPAPAPQPETQPRQGQIRQPARQAPSTGKVQTIPEADGLGPLPAAARSLVAQAEQASAKGRHAEAASLLERALRVAPKHPVLWQNLAVIRYRQSDYPQAEQLALRSNDLAGDQNDLKATNWALISVARNLRGDPDGARAAAAEASRLRKTLQRR